MNTQVHTRDARDGIAGAGSVNQSQAFGQLRGNVARAHSREELTRLYRHAEALIALTETPSWRTKYGERAEELRRAGEQGVLR